jgi:hypothetical protein
MKRLNPETGKPFKWGEVGHPFKHRSTKKVTKTFKGYSPKLNKQGFFYETWQTQKQLERRRNIENKRSYKKLETEDGHLELYLKNAKTRSKKHNLNFNLDLEYLKSIKTDKCPVFNTIFIWGLSRRGYLSTSATIDRVVPELGYIKGNVVFISNLANRIKSDATEVELYAVADWLHEKRKEVLNAFKEQLAPVPAGPDQQGEVYPELGTFSSAGTREDSYDLDHYQRTIRGEDSDYRTQTRGGDSVGRGVQEVGPPSQVTRLENHGESEPEIVRLDFSRRHLSD